MTTWLSSKTDDTSPLVIALQEVNGPVLKIMGYDGYAPTEEQDSSTKTALYVRRGTTHVQLDTQPWCSTTLSVVGCRLEVSPQRTILVFCVYVVPESTRNKANKAPVDLSFIPHFRKIYPQDVILLCGDFNSQHVAWGYNKCSPRGRRIMQDASAYGLTLLNTPQTHTRLGQTVHQADTSPDLTWSTRPQLFQWESCSKLNNLTELIDMHIHTQETRLRATNAGRYTLMLLGYDINTLPMLPNKTPPWEITVLTDGKPLPLNMDPNQRARRLNYAKRHARATSSLPMTERVVYTDAALPADGTSNTCYATAWYDQTNRKQSRRYHASADAMYSTRAELVGILDYLEWALEMSPQTDPVHHRVYTDSQAAHRACANVLYTDPVLQKIRHQTRLLRECGHDVTIHWVPGHCGIPGNEKAHRLARAHLLTALARASDTPSTFLATPPELADPIADKHITKQRRAAYLTAVGNPLSIPLLPSKVFTRRESVLLRRIQAGTLLTPFLLNRFHRGDTPPPVTGLCSTCNCRADLNHLCWECPVYNPPRLRALATIKRGPWPSSLRTWACPEPSPPDRAIEFWRALIMFLQDPAAPPVGDRLRDSHKIQAIQAAPT
ncbi:hypothetical protein HPB51_024179 [Rhipicephalus microplus]|uniref:RNase H type-1 domain-containing protein n=2 Tax=Rhipicephalus microplus TaxID=6941 RepID=A0A9J6E598_RHIMP|nr:hypothetical protein HPB51_024179 [Rhipicephalus microplus]